MAARAAGTMGTGTAAISVRRGYLSYCRAGPPPDLSSDFLVRVAYYLGMSVKSLFSK
jgi:hypothetical protein